MKKLKTKLLKVKNKSNNKLEKYVIDYILKTEGCEKDGDIRNELVWFGFEEMAKNLSIKIGIQL